MEIQTIHENAFENVVCKMAAILSRPNCEKPVCYDGTRLAYPSLLKACHKLHSNVDLW